MRIGSVCSGYEGLGLAVHEVLGGELAWVADIDPGASAILAHRFPGVPNLGDITVTDWAALEPVDVLTAGFPCQDVSQAGARAGLKPGTRSGVWLEVVKAIRVLRPRLVLIENVRGLLSARGDEPTPEHLAAEAARDLTVKLLDWLATAEAVARAKGDMRRAKQCRARTARVMGLRKRAVARCQWHERRLVRAIGTVLGNLASLGFDAEGVVVSAAEAGAPHRRERVFILAWPAAHAERAASPRLADTSQRGADGGTAADRDRAGAREEDTPADAERLGHGRHPGSTGEADPLGTRPRPAATGRCPGTVPDPDSTAGGERRIAAPGETESGRSRADASGRGGAPAADAASCRCDGGAPLPLGQPTERTSVAGGSGSADGRDAAADARGARLGQHPAVDWGPYTLAIRRWEHVTGRPAPRPTEPGRTGERLSPRFVEWLMGLPEGWVTDVPGLSRNAQLKALGNGVVPQQAAMALRLLLDRAGITPLVAADTAPAETRGAA